LTVFKETNEIVARISTNIKFNWISDTKKLY